MLREGGREEEECEWIIEVSDHFLLRPSLPPSLLPSLLTGND